MHLISWSVQLQIFSLYTKKIFNNTSSKTFIFSRVIWLCYPAKVSSLMLERGWLEQLSFHNIIVTCSPCNDSCIEGPQQQELISISCGVLQWEPETKRPSSSHGIMDSFAHYACRRGHLVEPGWFLGCCSACRLHVVSPGGSLGCHGYRREPLLEPGWSLSCLSSTTCGGLWRVP